MLAGLADLLADSDANVRVEATKAARALGPEVITPEILAGLTQCLADLKWNVRSSAAITVGKLGPAATPEMLAMLARCLCDSDKHVRNQTAWAVADLGATAATPEMLAALLTHWLPNVYPENGAVEALGRIGSLPLINLLEQRFNECSNQGTQLLKVIQILQSRWGAYRDLDAEPSRSRAIGKLVVWLLGVVGLCYPLLTA
jgi:HEAT repeat protein